MTSKGSKVLIGYCSICNRKKSLTVSDNTIQAEGFCIFFKTLGESAVKVGKILAKNVFLNTSRAVDFTENFATAAASINPKNVLSTCPELIHFYHMGKKISLPFF